MYVCSYGETKLMKMLTPNQNQETVGESRMEKMRKFLSSPLTRKKPHETHCKTFGTPLDLLMQKSPSEHSVPFIVTRICQYIQRAGLTQEGLFRISGNARSIDRLKISFDRSGDAPLETEGDVPSAAALLKLFLRELPEPIIPLSMHQQFLNAVKGKDKEKSISQLMILVEKLPDTNYCVLNYLSGFLRQVSALEEQNRMSAASLGIVFGPNLFRVTEDFVGLKEQSLTNQIVSFFITDYNTIFKHKTEVYAKEDYECPSVSMVSSWPKSKAMTGSMISTWSLQPLSVSIPAVDDSYLSLESFSHSIDTDQVCTLLVSSPTEKTDSSLSNLQLFSCLEKEDTKSESLPEIQMNYSDGKETLNLSDSFTLGQISSTGKETFPNADSCQFFSSTGTYPCDFKEEYFASKSNQDILKAFEDNSPKSDLDLSTNIPSLQNMRNEGIPDGKIMESNHKSYHRGHRHRTRRHKKRHTDDVGKNVSDHSDYSMENDPKDDFLRIDDEFDGNINPVPKLLHDKDFLGDATNTFEKVNSDTRHSWPSVRKFREEEDIALSPLPQQLRTAVLVEAPLSPSAFRSYLSHRNLHLDPSLPPSPPVEQEDLAIGGVDEESKTTAKQLLREIHGLKKKIKQFEDNFETLYGHRPSHAEKCGNAVTKKMISDLNNARQELKKSKDQPLSWISNAEEGFPMIQSKLSKGTNTRSGKSVLNIPSATSADLDIEDSVRNATEYLLKQRKEAQRSEVLEEMTKEQLVEEKLAIQKILLNFESCHGRPSSKSHREAMRPLYDRYRCVKRLISRTVTNSLAKETSDLQPIIEHETMDFSSSEKTQTVAENNGTCNGTEQKKPSLPDSKTEVLESKELSGVKPQMSSHCNYHELSLSDLLSEQQLARDEKRRLRKLLRDFEDQFKHEHGRKVQREDKRAMESEYSEYKNTKAKLKLLEALVSKHGQGP